MNDPGNGHMHPGTAGNSHLPGHARARSSDFDAMVVRQSEPFDVIVVGSGITGGLAAKEFCEKGLRTLMLERGPWMDHITSYQGEHKAPWELPYRGRGDRKLYETDYQVQSTCYAFGEATRQFFVNDRQHPYLTDEDKPFRWIRGYHLGGRSLTWGRQVYRWSDLDFEANAHDGFGVDWPIRYADIAPWYDYVERFVGISGQAEGLPQLPDGVFQTPMPLNIAERFVRDGIRKAYGDRTLTIGRAAILTEPHNGRAPCHYCGPCHRGCSTASYYSTLGAALPPARATGNLSIKCDAIVHSVIHDPETRRATGVRVIDAFTRETTEYSAKVIFLCASTLGTTQILLNSTSTDFPDGMGNASGALGHYLMDHPYTAGADGTVPGFEDTYLWGNMPNGIYVPRFRNLDPRSQKLDFLRGYGYQGGGYREGWSRGTRMPGFGADLKNALRTPGPWRFGIEGWGEHLPRHENRVELDPNTVDDYGIPLLRIHCTWSDNERTMRRDIARQAAEMLEAAGCTNVTSYVEDAPPGYCIHEMGTARMGRDPKTSVLNGHNQVWDVPNLYVTDGACMASSACQNPSITYMALTARAVDHAVGELKRMNL